MRECGDFSYGSSDEIGGGPPKTSFGLHDSARDHPAVLVIDHRRLTVYHNGIRRSPDGCAWGNCEGFSE